MSPEGERQQPPICDYEGSSYQATFWDQGERDYEDQAEAVALERLLPGSGDLLLEIGAGAGRNTTRYAGFRRVALLDYSVSQLRQARERLGADQRYVYVAADAYRLPFVSGLFDSATMIRVLHHMADAPQALGQVHAILRPQGIFVLEFASKRHLKAILRYWLGRQPWSPFSPEPVEFAPLNFDFHPTTVRRWLQEAGFRVERLRTVSHFRLAMLKRTLPTRLLVGMDALLQPTGDWFQLTPSVFVRASASPGGPAAPAGAFFRCPECGQTLDHHPYEQPVPQDGLTCPDCGRHWAVEEGIFVFK
jgi:ubiquinone/menaquinone biosynthesis C-methylase UbiE